MNFENTQICTKEEVKRETAKELLENMGAILGEMANQIALISDAVYRGDGNQKSVLTNESCATPPLVVIMREQRDTAEYLLKEIMKIRDVLW